ncbi:septum formation initiator family protein [Mangrovimicrobium sediminis]|nr:septum formation initiator family protein [Haliea sp. SAOS-164]
MLAILVALLLLLQYRLWFADGSLAEVHRLRAQVEEFDRVNEELRTRNAVLEREVLDLQSGNQGVEQRAREQLNLVRDGEVFYQVEEDASPAPGEQP